jgi:hypothetical protein
MLLHLNVESPIHERLSHRSLNIILAALVALTFVAAAPAQAPASAPSLGKADAARYLDTDKTLASPDMEGRGAGTKGIDRAAHLLEQRYQSLGLDPAGTQGFFQPFTVTTGAKLVSGNDLQEDVGGKKKILKLNEDFVPFSFSSSGQAAAPVVFAGYGATAGEFGYDDYAGLDVQGKVVVLLRCEGRSPGAHPARFFDHESDQRPQSRRQGRRRDQWQAWRR